jgi:hypothetical protein
LREQKYAQGPACHSMPDIFSGRGSLTGYAAFSTASKI